MLGLQPIHIVIIVVVALLIFGPKRLPEMGRSIGKAINEFRNGTREITEGLQAEVNGSATGQVRQPAPPPASSVAFQASTSTPIAQGRFCIQCGSANLPEARFCSQCGSKLPENTIQPSEPSILDRQAKSNADPADSAHIHG